MTSRTIPSLAPSRFLVIFATGLIAVAAACSGGVDDPTLAPRSTSVPGVTPSSTAQSTPTSPGNRPTPTTSPVSPTATVATQPTPTNTVAATSVPATVQAATSTPVATASPVPSATSAPPTPTPAPVVIFTPGVVNTVQLVAAKDNTLYQSSTGATSNGSGQGIFVGKTNNGSLRRGLIHFAISSLVPAGSTIESVEISMSVTRTATGSEPITIHRVTSDWGEGTSDAAAQEGGGTNAASGDATWTHTFSPNQMWKTPGGDFIMAPSALLNVLSNGRYTWTTNSELVADVQSWIDNPGSNFGWILTGDEVSSKTAKRFASRENTDESARPVLVIQFTPPA